jgi:hypothetical protein
MTAQILVSAATLLVVVWVGVWVVADALTPMPSRHRAGRAS